MPAPATPVSDDPSSHGGAGEVAEPHRVAPGWRALGWLGLFVALSVVVSVALYPIPGLDDLTRGAVASLAAGLLASWAMLHHVDRRERPFAALGFATGRHAWGEWWGGVAVGALMLGVAVGVLAVAGSARWVADTGTIPEYVAALVRLFVFFAVAAAAEEVMLRGYAFQAAVEGLGPWPATLLFSLIFGALHGTNPGFGAFAFANIFLAGVMLSVAYLRTRSLWFATAVHLGWNWMMGAVLDLPVSGLDKDAPLLDARELGADWWTGGSFGPEAGAAATLAVLAGTAWLLWTRWLREADATRAAAPLVDRRLRPEWPR